MTTTTDLIKNTQKEQSQYHSLVDIGINPTYEPLKKNWKGCVQRAIDKNVKNILLTGTSVRRSWQLLDMAKDWYRETGQRNLLVTVGVHPHEAKTFLPSPSPQQQQQDQADAQSCTNDESQKEQEKQDTISVLREMLQDPFVVAVGECGLDYHRNLSTQTEQLHAFERQLELACETQMPLFLHEREAHEDLLAVLDRVAANASLPPLPPIVIHCFTGTREEAQEYIRRGYFIGFTGTICKKERGEPLREILPDLPLESLMVETDAPFMGFKKGRKRGSEPADVVDVARKLAEVMGLPFHQVCEQTTLNAHQFFRLGEQ